MQYFIYHTIGLTDLLHPSPAPSDLSRQFCSTFRSVQMFSTIPSYVTNRFFFKFKSYLQMKILILAERCFGHCNSGCNFTSCIFCYHATQIVHIFQFFWHICLQILKLNILFTLQKFLIMTSACPTRRIRNAPMEDGERYPEWAM